MPIELPDHTTARREPVDVTRRTFLRFLAPALPLRGAAAPSRFTALADTDAGLKWLRCFRVGPQLRPG